MKYYHITISLKQNVGLPLFVHMWSNLNITRTCEVRERTDVVIFDFLHKYKMPYLEWQHLEQELESRMHFIALLLATAHHLAFEIGSDFRWGSTLQLLLLVMLGKLIPQASVFSSRKWDHCCLCHSIIMRIKWKNLCEVFRMVEGNKNFL